MTLRLRAADSSDAERLFAWVNSADSLANKRLTTGKIPWESHVGWLANLLQNPAACLWIIEHENGPVGQLRLSPDRDGRRLVDIYIVPAARQSGLAASALRLALDQAAQLWPRQPVFAEVLTENWPSRRLFTAVGFHQVNEDATCVTYEITP